MNNSLLHEDRLFFIFIFCFCLHGFLREKISSAGVYIEEALSFF